MRALPAGAVLSGLAATAGAAYGQALPGTRDDVAETLAIVPSVVDVPLGVSFDGIVVRGGSEADTLILVDGFAIPRLLHVRGLRSVMPMSMISEGSLKTAPDASIGPSAAVALDTGARTRQIAAEATTFDLGAGLLSPGSAFHVRSSLAPRLYDLSYVAGQLRVDTRVSSRLVLAVSALWAADRDERDGVSLSSSFARATAAATYTRGDWTARFALSTLPTSVDNRRGELQRYDVAGVSIDTRTDVMRRAGDLAGLTDVEWHIGEQTSVTRYDADVAWPLPPREGSPQPQHPAADDTALRVDDRFVTSDAALWTSIAASLSPSVRATTGMRVDVFGRGGDVATQPRGELVAEVAPRTRVGLAAGAHRRAPERGEELFTDRLNPERTTQVTARVEHTHQGLTVQGNAYYIDRRRLVMRDAGGLLRNTGTGTSSGLEASVQLKLERWFAWATASVSRSTRKDFPAAAERPSQFDQPLRLDLLVNRRWKRWQLGGRIQVASGLPATSIQESIYDADGDAYAPIFGRTYDERLPWQYELDVRIDRLFRAGTHVRVYAFLDLALSPSTIGYDNRFDYKQRTAVTLPVVPFAGLRGAL
jgi:hypothetical protein